MYPPFAPVCNGGRHRIPNGLGAMEPELIESAEQLIGCEFNDKDLLSQALTHASLVDSRFHSNERLEFLGDSVLSLVVCDYLFQNYDDLMEGEMTKIKSSVVSRRVCADIAREMGFTDLLRLGKGMSNHAELPGSVLAAVYESIVGAIYLDQGFEAVQEFILDGLKKRIRKAARSGHQSNFKSVLQQIAQQELNTVPQYKVLDEKGPDHSKCFEVSVALGAKRFESCWGSSKKQAEQKAALKALMALGYVEENEEGEVMIVSPDRA